MSEKQGHTPGPWREGKTRAKLASGGILHTIASDRAPNHIVAFYSPALLASEANAALIVRLFNLYWAGVQRNKAQDDAITAAGMVPPDLNYGLTEGEVAAAQMANGLMAENAALLEALEKIEVRAATTAEDSEDDLRRWLSHCRQLARAAIASARGK